MWNAIEGYLSSSCFREDFILNITSQPREVIPTAVFPGSNKMVEDTLLSQLILRDSYHLEH